MYLIIKLILKVREYRNILLIDELILNEGNRTLMRSKNMKRYSSGKKYDAKNFSVPFTHEEGFVPFMDIVNTGGAKVHAIFEANREVSWYVVEGEKRTEYADGVQRRLEDAYRLMQSGSGPQYPTVAVDGAVCSLRNMQECSATGVTGLLFESNYLWHLTPGRACCRSNRLSWTEARNAGTELQNLRLANRRSSSWSAKGVANKLTPSSLQAKSKESSSRSANIDRSRTCGWPSPRPCMSTLNPVNK